jgi:hypothetical protein
MLLLVFAMILLLEVIVAKSSLRYLLIPFLLRFIVVLIVNLLLVLLVLLCSKVSKLSLIIRGSSSYNLTWIVNLIVILVVLATLNTLIRLPTSWLPFVQMCLLSGGRESLVLNTLAALLVLLK